LALSFPESEPSALTEFQVEPDYFFASTRNPQVDWRFLRKSQGPSTVFERMIEVLELEQRVAECNALIEHQRQLIEQLGNEGRDITSAQIVFDSLLVSLYLHLQDRQRLSALNGKAEVRETGFAGVEKPKHVA
jgi:hypothetical protein